MSSRDTEIAEIDAFLEGPKVLIGSPPIWEQGSRRGEMTATWNLADELGISAARFRFRCAKAMRGYTSMSLVFRGHAIWRIDLDAPSVCKPNPLWAVAIGLPAIVCGSHGHEWPDNREHARRLEPGPWELSARRPIPPQIRRLPQAIAWFAQRINLTLSPAQRGFDVPPQSELFDGGRLK